MENEATVRILSCTFCDFRCYKHQSLLKHIKGVHGNDPNFLIYCRHCSASYKRWDSLCKHIQRVHHDEQPSPTSTVAIEQGKLIYNLIVCMHANWMT